MITSLILWFLLFFFPLDKNIINPIIGFQILFCLASFLFLKKGNNTSAIFSMKWENPNFYASLIFISIIFLYFIDLVYKKFPKTFYGDSAPIFEMEMSFISSIRFGINQVRENFWFYKDPLRNGHYTLLPSLPYIFLASISQFGFSFQEASKIICFFNMISTFSAVSCLAANFLRKIDFVPLIFIVNSGWALIHYLNYHTKTDTIDLIHTFGRTAPWYNILFEFLSLSKYASFSIPIAIFAFSMTTQTAKKSAYILAGVLMALIPSPAVSIAIFITTLSFSNSSLYTLPFAISLVPKLLFGCITYKPLFKEYQMNGIFYSQLLIWFDSFGPLFFVLILLPIVFYNIKDKYFTEKFLLSLSSFIILCFIRIGNDYFENSLAILTVFFPMLVIAFIYFINYLIKRSSKRMKGFLFAVKFFVFLFYLLGSYYSMKTILSHKSRGLRKNNISLANYVWENINPKDAIFSNTFKLNPIPFFSGMQIFVGDIHELWRKGANITSQLQFINLIKETGNGPSLIKQQKYKYLLEKQGQPLVATNATFINLFDVIYTDEDYVIMKFKDESQ